MQPRNIMLYILLSVPTVILLLLSNLLNTKGKKNIRMLAILVAILMFIGRPMWVHYKASEIQRNVNSYLSKTYSNRQWTIIRYDKYHPAGSPYIMAVTFNDDQGIVYLFAVGSESEIKLVGWGESKK